MSRRLIASATLLLLPLTFACSSSGSTDGTGSNVSNGPNDPNDPEPTEGCDYSLTSYSGDCLKLPVPSPSEGFQLHYGPSDYDNPDEVARFVLAPAEELVDCQYMTSPNDSLIRYDRYQARMRPGTHHLILFAVDDPTPDGALAPCDGLGGLNGTWMFAAQGGLDAGGGAWEYPVEGSPPENEGLAFSLQARTKIAYQLHYVNSTEEPLLRESWSNLYFAAETEATQLADPITFFGGLNMAIAPGVRDVVKASCTASVDARIVDMWPHQHAHGVRFTAHKVSASGARTLVYETYDWEEPPTLYFDSVHQNPVPDAAAGITGGYSGLLTLAAGDRIEYECEIDNDTDLTLRFANEAFTAEMCNLFGTYTPGAGTPWKCFN